MTPANSLLPRENGPQPLIDTGNQPSTNGSVEIMIWSLVYTNLYAHKDSHTTYTWQQKNVNCSLISSPQKLS